MKKKKSRVHLKNQVETRTISSTAIGLVVGLGNPGGQYEATRHNAGFWFADLVAQKYGGIFRTESKFFGQTCRIQLDNTCCELLKPSTYINRSGRSVSSFARYFNIPLEQMLIAHDELDLPAGIIRLKQGGGHAGHNGLRDIANALGGRDFWRLRVGIDRPQSGINTVDYVLGRPSRESVDLIKCGLNQAVELLPEIVTGEFPKAMNLLHRRE